ncbi:Dyp-type peroxidase [Nocardia abscessus]|uniref:Dyp-type peroxidase n=1 Tax=Nocardia abscessus TaxID=120957 RepID=UPI00313E804E
MIGPIHQNTSSPAYFLGFVPATFTRAARGAAAPALVGEEDPQFTGGSYVIVQKYTHPLTDWRALSVEEQERVIGRTKLDDFELPDEIKPADSHVEVNTLIDPDGTERQILRGNMPFGSVRDGVFGTYYIAYAATPSVTERMLTRMFLGTDEAAYDRILDFSVALTGTSFFAPTVDFLDDLPPAPSETAEPAVSVDTDGAGPADLPATAAPAGDGALAIGSLKRSTRL